MNAAQNFVLQKTSPIHQRAGALTLDLRQYRRNLGEKVVTIARSDQKQHRRVLAELSGNGGVRTNQDRYVLVRVEATDIGKPAPIANNVSELRRQSLTARR